MSTATKLAEHLPRAILAEDLPQEEAVQAAFYRFVGRPCVQQVLEQTAEQEVAPDTGPTLAKSIAEANQGNQEADARVDISVGTALSEAYFKEKHFTRTVKKLEGGKVIQFGLETDQMHQDSLVLRPKRSKVLKEFTLAEAVNGLREREMANSGELQDSWLVVASFVPEDLPEDQLDYRGDGYFTRSMTYSLQGTTQEGGNIVTETVFDKGTDAGEYASYDKRQAGRFDLPAVGRVYEWLGLPAPKTALEALRRPARIPKRLMPNGMIDFWRWVDMAADQIRGEQTARTVQEYIERVNVSRAREASITGVRIEVKRELLGLDGTFEKDIDAIDALWELARRHGPKEAVRNDLINPIVFGVRAAHKLLMAKDLIGLGNLEDSRLLVEAAQEVATVGGCGGGRCGLIEVDTTNPRVMAMMSRLNFQPGDRIIQDTERPCGGCGHRGEVFYVYNEAGTKVNKGCAGCGATEFGGE